MTTFLEKWFEERERYKDNFEGSFCESFGKEHSTTHTACRCCLTQRYGIAKACKRLSAEYKKFCPNVEEDPDKIGDDSFNTDCNNTGTWNIGRCNTGNNNKGDNNAGTFNIGDHNSGYHNKGDNNTGTFNTGDHNSGYHNKGDFNVGDYNIGHSNTGKRNIGNYNTGNENFGCRNVGNCNLGNLNLGVFNCVGDSQIAYCSYNTSHVNSFLCSKNVSIIFNKIYHGDPRKIRWPDFFTKAIEIFGQTFSELKAEYLDNVKDKGDVAQKNKEMYHKIWQHAWDDATYIDRRRVLNIPNFDNDVFKDITGINVYQELNIKVKSGHIIITR